MMLFLDCFAARAMTAAFPRHCEERGDEAIQCVRWDGTKWNPGFKRWDYAVLHSSLRPWLAI
ncbi:MAG: hypothetical protein FWF20_10990 [Betaproteobacteria bacterium]|nr:hypothetical protein [Betaproteobacteria bacterium]